MFLLRLLLFLLLCVGISLTGYSQNALHFDGTNDYVQTNYGGISGSAARTVEAWIKTPFQSNQEVITDWGTFSTGQRFTLNLIGGGLRCEISGAGLTTTTQVGDNQWHHVAVTFDNSATPKYRLFIDGSLDTAFNLGVGINTGSNIDMRIGVRIDGANSFTGLIDEVRVWNYARTEAEISNAMNSEFCSLPTGLVAYYKLNQGTAGGNNTGNTTAVDLVNSNQNGTLTNFALSGNTSNWATGYPLNVGSTSATVAATGCGGSYISPSGNYTWTSAGTYADTIPNAFGCDSVLTINLSMSNNTTASISPTVCDSFTSPSGLYTWGTSGTYTDTIANSAGCDSIITIQLEVQNTSGALSVTACESYTSPSGNHTWSFSGTYMDTIANAAGCDSILTIQLTVNSSSSGFISETACLSFTSPSGNHTWNASGTYQDTVTNAAGCDSIITIDLTVKPVDTEVNKATNVLTAAAFGATFQWLDCNDNYSPLSGKTGPTLVVTQTGSYAVAVTQDGCTDTSVCEDVTIIGIREETSGGIHIYPNPSRGLVHITYPQETGNTQLMLRDLQGALLERHHLPAGLSHSVQLHQPAGCYLLELQSESGNVQSMIVLVD